MLQLSDNDPRKQGMVISVANNLMKFYDPDKVAVEIVAFGPGIDLLQPDNPNRKLVESLVGAGRAGRYLPQHRRYAGTRDRQAAGIHCGGNAGSGRRRADSVSDREWLYVGETVNLYRHCERSEAIHLPFCGTMDCFAALAMTILGEFSLCFVV